jgi:hypothetical protein
VFRLRADDPGSFESRFGKQHSGMRLDDGFLFPEEILIDL